MQTFFKDIQYGWRILLKSPGFTVVAVLALAIGIGANTAIFSVVNSVLLRPLPLKDSKQLVSVWCVQPQLDRAPSSYPEFLDWRDHNQDFESMAGFQNANFNLTGMGEAERVAGGVISWNYFQMLGVQPRMGRTFLQTEDQPGGGLSVIMTEGFWKRRFGSDPAVLVRTLTLNARSYTVVGILPAVYVPRLQGDLFVPLALDPGKMNRGSHFLEVLGRLKPGHTVRQAQAEMNTLAAHLREQYKTDHGIKLDPLQDLIVRDSRVLLWILLGIVGFVLLIACANVANLQLARANSRQKELAVRMALGASRGRLIRQWLTESTVLGAMGGAVGVLLAFWCLHLLVNLTPGSIPVPRLKEVRIDSSVLGFTLGVSLLTSLLFGLVPAIKASNMDLNRSLKEGGRGGSAFSGHRLARGLLMASEVALAMILLVGAGLMLNSFFRLMRVNPGFNPENILTLRINLPAAKYSAGPAQTNFYRQVLERIQNIPAVESVGLINSLPLSGSSTNGDFNVEGPTPWRPGQGPLTEDYIASTDYFRALGIPLLEGRFFNDHDTADAPKVTIVSEAFAKRVWPRADPIGKRIDLGWPVGGWIEVVGVVGDVHNEALNSPVPLETYMPYQQAPFQSFTMVVKTQGDPMKFIGAVRSKIQNVDRDQPLFDIRSLQQVMASSTRSTQFNMSLLLVFAGLALVLAAVGIYGVTSYSVTQRTHEIGIRMALGASRGNVLQLVLRQGMGLTILGIVAGWVAAVALTRLMSTLLFGVKSTDPLTFGLTALTLLFVSLLACYFPARRATQVDPLVALRYE